jgi:hypothetical protein
MSAFVLGPQKIQCFGLREPAALARFMFEDELGERFTDDHTDLERLAGILTGIPAGTIEHDDVGRCVEDEISGFRIRDNLFKVSQRNFLVDGNDRMSLIMRQYFTMVAIGPPFSSFRTYPWEDPMEECVNILIRPATIYISMESVDTEQLPDPEFPH